MSIQPKKDSGDALDRFYVRLFKDGHLFPALPEVFRQKAEEVESAGAVKLNDVTYVKCVNFKDKDIRYAHNRQCQGIIPFNRLRKHDDRRFYCPDCAREIYPYGKELFTGWRVGINEAAVLLAVKTRLSEFGTSIKEPCTGVVRFEYEGAEVHVCVWDYCSDEKYKFPTAPSHFKPIVYIYVNADQFRDRTPTGARAVWIKDFLLATKPDLREIFVSADADATTPVDVVDVMKFREQERTLPKPSYTFNNKAGHRMLHKVVVTAAAIKIDNVEIIPAKNKVSYEIFRALADLFVEDLRNGLGKDEFHSVQAHRLKVDGKEFDDKNSAWRSIDRLRKQTSEKLSEEFRVPFGKDEIIENPKGKTGFRLNPHRVMAYIETSKEA